MANEGCVDWTAMEAKDIDWAPMDVCEIPIIVKEEDGFAIEMEDGKEIELEEGSQS